MWPKMFYGHTLYSLRPPPETEILLMHYAIKMDIQLQQGYPGEEEIFNQSFESQGFALEGDMCMSTYISAPMQNVRTFKRKHCSLEFLTCSLHDYKRARAISKMKQHHVSCWCQVEDILRPWSKDVSYAQVQWRPVLNLSRHTPFLSP